MSLIKKIVILCVIFVCGGGAFYFVSTEKTRSSFYSNLTQSSFTSKGVINRTIQIDIRFPSASDDNEKIEVTSAISLPFKFDEKLYYRWHLSEGVILKEGEPSGELLGLAPNESKKVSIFVTGFSKENVRQIKFEIYGFKNRQKIYGDAIISSDLENTFENTVQNVEKIKASE